MDVKNLFVAEVIDNNDENQEGRVQINIESFMSGFSPDELPWARPMNSLTTGGSSDYGISFIPEIGSKIWVFFENPELRKNAFYIGNVNLKNLNPHNLGSDISVDGFTSEYPNTKFIYLSNGIGLVFSSDKKEIAMYHPDGSFVAIQDDGEIHIKAGSTTLESSLLGETTVQFLKDFLDGILALTVNSPVGPTSPPINSATFTALKTQADSLLSEKVKNN